VPRAWSARRRPGRARRNRVGLYSHEVLSPGSDEPFQDAYGPTMLSALGYIERLWGIGPHMDRVWFSLCGGLEYEYRAGWNSHEYLIRSDGQHAVAKADGQAIYEGPCGLRLITDEAGRILDRKMLE